MATCRDPCNEHRSYFIESLVKIKLYNTCKKMSQEQKKTNTIKTAKRKIAILKNA